MPFSLEHTQKDCSVQGNSYFGLQSRTLNHSLRCNLAVKKGLFFSWVNIFPRIESLWLSDLRLKHSVHKSSDPYYLISYFI